VTRDRRRFLLAASALLASRAKLAQGRTRLPALGFLSPHPRPTPQEDAKRTLFIKLRELGWTDGQTFRYVGAYAGGSEARLPELAAELVRKDVDAIYAVGPEAAVAAARATKAIPIVFWAVPFPMEYGLVESLARPGRNVTGVAWYAGPGVDAKRLEVLREIAPDAKRLANLTVPTAALAVSGETVKVGPILRPVAKTLGYDIRDFPVTAPADFEPAFSAMLSWGAQALTAWGTTLTYRERHRIADFASRNRLPSSFTLRAYVEAGGLVSYAIALAPTAVRVAEYLDQVLRGTKPAELPVSVPRDYELTVNLRTAKALGLSIPQSVMLRADRVIE